MTSAQMKERTKQFTLRVIRLVKQLPKDQVSHVLGNQLLRSGSSVGANYRAACRARSKAEFRAKLGIVEEEGDESLFWMEILLDTGMMSRTQLGDLMKEADEIVAIVVSSIKSSRS